MDQISIANYTLEDQDKKIILGKPDNILFIEDLCIRYSLEELGNLFPLNTNLYRKYFL